ncbi:hypothetical protein [Nocardia sp. NPDC127526]|uniref:hypothetical protein n=1 Tax=Nocardia sp. NPDC127526 TaxID=3345393 RepID=UPI003625F5D9
MTTIERLDLGVIDGFRIHARMYGDEDESPERKYDPILCDPELMAGWRADEWFFVGVQVTASRAGVELGEASVWSLEYGWYDGRYHNPLTDSPATHEDWVYGNGPGLIHQAIADAFDTMAAIKKPPRP